VSGPVTGTDRDALMKILSEFESFRAGDGHMSIRMKDDRSSAQIADEILASGFLRVALETADGLEANRARAARLDPL
jgi:hypothetical protein